ncbi:hypothetical protein ACH4UY_04795 [Streptomyces longwoodensis]|uniref:hypothetical protein n=1 Tax=Streptomyces longwoodensis TaxID=68231 RepID=UPI0037A8805F
MTLSPDTQAVLRALDRLTHAVDTLRPDQNSPTWRERADQAEAGRVAADNMLREVCAVFGGPHVDPILKARETLARAERAEAAIERVRALHRKASHGRTCVYCAHGQRLGYDTDWPCDTVRALDTAEQSATEEQP